MILASMLAPVEALLNHARSEKATKWPLVREEPILRAINTWVAMRDMDRDTLKRVANWTHPTPYRADGLPGYIADTWAAYLIGDEPQVTAGAKGDQAAMDELLEINQFASELERGVSLAVSEGEIWARIYRDQLVAPAPLVDWVSRGRVLPLWYGPRLVAAAIWDDLPKPANAPTGTYFRLFEVHAPGLVANRLFRGSETKLGRLVDLTDHPMTRELAPEWETGLEGMAVERIPNRLRASRQIGVSDYARIMDPLLDLNEVGMIGAHNVRLTGRKRAVVSQTALRASTTGDNDLTPEENPGAGINPPRARFDAAEEVFVQDALDGELGRDAKDPFRILEYSFDAEALIAWKRDLVETAVSRIGLTPQYLGVAGSLGEGYAISGTALRLRLIPQDNAGRSKARYVDDVIPRLLTKMATLDKVDPAFGFGRAWTQPDELPTFKRTPGIPVDEVEQAQRHEALLRAGAESVETAVRDLHPEWDDTAVRDEVQRIRDDKSSAGPSMFGP